MNIKLLGLLTAAGAGVAFVASFINKAKKPLPFMLCSPLMNDISREAAAKVEEYRQAHSDEEIPEDLYGRFFAEIVETHRKNWEKAQQDIHRRKH